MATRRGFNPTALTLDDGRSFAGNMTGNSLLNIGAEQHRLRSAQVAQDDFDTEYGPNRGFGPGRMLRPLGSPWDNAYFGLMQARENAANESGRNFNFDERSWGNAKALDVPTNYVYHSNAGELAPGYRKGPGGTKGSYRPGEVAKNTQGYAPFDAAREELRRSIRGRR